MPIADWIAVDWGTTHLRAWAMQDNASVAHSSSDDGMARLAKPEFEPALLRLVAGWLGEGTTRVIACGMVGARQGWVEAPYKTVPAAPVSDHPVRASSSDPRISAFVVPGLRQMAPKDVMRGEETQIAGFLALNPGWDGVLCLPGTHTKWALISAGEVVSFQTFMTGELFSTLSRQSVLRHSIAPQGWDDEAFLEALEDAMAKPERLAARLFELRARDLLEAYSPVATRARLSGMLIGAELAAARPYWLGQQVAIIGSAQTSGPYAAALNQQGVSAIIADNTAMTLAGLNLVNESLRETA